MGQLALRSDGPANTLGVFGYTEREAAFLRLAALHGGYFLRRQYGQFVGKAGGTASTFIQKIVALKHAKASTYATSTCVYHLGARPFYQALGQPDNRNRRERQPLSIKNRLMGLDFVLGHPNQRFLATEHEKVEYFNGLLKIDRNLLPAKAYPSSNGQGSTARYFVDKYPIGLSERMADPAAPNVSFCFVDEGARTVSRFETYLDQYRSLFAALPRFALIYVAAGPLLFRAAEHVFQRVVRGSSQAHSRVRPAASADRLTEYFETRRLFEAGQFSSFDRAKLLRFRAQREAFSSQQTEALYQRWKQGGAFDSSALANSKPSAALPLVGTFSTCLLEQNYDLFGTLTSF